MLCDSLPEVLEVRLQGATLDDTDTDLEFEMLDGAGEHCHTQGSRQRALFLGHRESSETAWNSTSDLGLSLVEATRAQLGCCLFNSHTEAERVVS